jgi:hypothetical protein
MQHSSMLKRCIMRTPFATLEFCPRPAPQSVETVDHSRRNVLFGAATVASGSVAVPVAAMAAPTAPTLSPAFQDMFTSWCAAWKQADAIAETASDDVFDTLISRAEDVFSEVIDTSSCSVADVATKVAAIWIDQDIRADASDAPTMGHVERMIDTINTFCNRVIVLLRTMPGDPEIRRRAKAQAAASEKKRAELVERVKLWAADERKKGGWARPMNFSPTWYKLPWTVVRRARTPFAGWGFMHLTTPAK